VNLRRTSIPSSPTFHAEQPTLLPFPSLFILVIADCHAPDAGAKDVAVASGCLADK
jgi:hypothetical protein